MRSKEENPKNSLIGREAPLKYYQNYKNLKKILSKNQLNSDLSGTISIDRDPSTLVLEETERLGILPCCMGLVKTKG